MPKRISKGYRVFQVINYIILIGLALICILPILNLLAISLSGKYAIDANKVTFWPIDFNVDAYKVIFQTKEFFRAFWISIERVILGVPMFLVVTILMAYPLSKSGRVFRGRNVYMTIIAIVCFISGGQIPFYLLIKNLGWFDTIWALTVPLALNVSNGIMLMNFFRQLPKDIEESAFIDGAGYFRALIFIVLPLSLPILATLSLFCFVSHWNSWYDGRIFNLNPYNYPLQTFLRDILTANRPESMEIAKDQFMVADRAVTSAQIFIAMLPVLVIYPFLQKYFVKGIVVGSVKG